MFFTTSRSKFWSDQCVDRQFARVISLGSDDFDQVRLHVIEVVVPSKECTRQRAWVLIYGDLNLFASELLYFRERRCASNDFNAAHDDLHRDRGHNDADADERCNDFADGDRGHGWGTPCAKIRQQPLIAKADPHKLSLRAHPHQQQPREAHQPPEAQQPHTPQHSAPRAAGEASAAVSDGRDQAKDIILAKRRNPSDSGSCTKRIRTHSNDERVWIPTSSAGKYNSSCNVICFKKVAHEWQPSARTLVSGRMKI